LVAEDKRKYWRRLIAEQEASGQKVLPFCRERGIGEYSFYKWRKRLQQNGAVRFALLETTPTARAAVINPDPDSGLELVLNNGERLRIGKQVEVATLRRVLEAVRG
jgi:hypothetical protein